MSKKSFKLQASSDGTHDLVCPKCGHPVNFTDPVCPNCGFNIREFLNFITNMKPEKPTKLSHALFLLYIHFLISFMAQYAILHHTNLGAFLSALSGIFAFAVLTRDNVGDILWAVYANIMLLAILTYRPVLIILLAGTAAVLRYGASLHKN